MDDTGRISTAGFVATAVAFGPARMGYGLFLPEFRESFALSTGQAGMIASAAFGCFLLALLVTAELTSRLGPRAPVFAGGIAAAVGMALVALAPGAAVLTAGVMLAASASGFDWSPFNRAAERAVPAERRGAALSAVSTGTTVGIALAGLLALGVLFFGFTWRGVWWGFAAAGLASALLSLWALRGREWSAGRGIDRASILAVAEWRALPLFAAAFSFGVTSAIYLSFAVEHIRNAGGLPGLPPDAAGGIVFVAFGVTGIVGLLARDLEARRGLLPLLRAVFVCSAISLGLVGLLPAVWPAVVVSAGLQGLCVMTLSAIFAFWSLRLFPELPAVSFTATLAAMAAGNAAGPAIAGLAADRWSMEAVFLAAAALSLVTGAALPRRTAGQFAGAA